MVAVFILFELVIHNPVHRETTNNLIYLDLASGYFARMQMTQGADRDLSISMTQLIQLARDFVQQSRQTYTHAEEPEHQVETISTISSYSNLHGSHGSETRHIAHTPQEAQQTDLNTSINPLNFRQSTDFPIDGAVSIPKLYGKKEGY